MAAERSRFVEGDPLRIMLPIPAMGSGGAERAMAIAVERLAQRHDVVVLAWESQTSSPFSLAIED